MPYTTRLFRGAVVVPDPELTEPLNPEKEGKGTRNQANCQWKIHDLNDECFLFFVTISLAASMYIIALPGGNGVAATVSTLTVGGIGFINSIRLLHARFVCINGGDIRESINHLRMRTKELEETVSILAQAVDQLNVEADRMKRFEIDLRNIASQHGYEVDDVIYLSIENKMTLEKQKINLRLIVVFLVAEVFFHGDIEVSKERLPMLILQLQHKLNDHGIEVDTELLEEMIAKGGLKRLLQFCGKFLLTRFNEYEDEHLMNMFVQRDKTNVSGLMTDRPGQGRGVLAAINANNEHGSDVLRKVHRELAIKLSSMRNAIGPPLPKVIVTNS